MARFSYMTRGANGELVNGKMEADDQNFVADRLIARGLMPVSIKEVIEEKNLFDMDVAQLFISKKVNIQDLVMFSRQMYSLTKAGIPLTRAISGLMDTTGSQVLKNALEAINNDLNAGTNLTTAFSRHKKIFSPLYISLIHVGENSGRLEESFEQIARYLELEQKTKERIKSATRYPLFVTIAIVAAIFIINIFVIPQFSKLFASFDAGELPLATQVLMHTSEFFVDYWIYLICVISIIIYSFSYAVKTPKGRLIWDEYKLRIPIFGNIIYRSLLARFSRTFAMMSKSGVPLINALNIIAEVVDNHWVAKHINSMRDGVEKGESIRVVSTRTGMFSPLILQMISVGEETGKLDEMLDQVALFYEEQVDYDLKKLSDYIEPILIVFIGGIVLVLMLAVYLPMWDLTSQTRNG